MPYRQNFPIPAVINPPKTCLQIEIPDHPDWKAVISGLMFELTYWFNWERTGDTSGAQCAAVWKEVYNSIDWSDMSCCCTDKAKIQRINPGTGNVEQSTDGGATWQPAPGGIQSVIVQPVPPVTSGVAATKCDAASNVREQCSGWVDQVSNDFDTAVTLLEFGQLVVLAIVGAVLTVLTAGALTAVEISILTALGAALVAAWGAGKSVFVAYWTSDKLDTILCAAYCNIGDDGSFTSAQFSAFWNDCNADLPASPAKMLFMGFLSSVGMPGLNAMAASGLSADSDCSDCVACLTCPERFSLYYATGTAFSRGDGWIQVTSVESALTGSQSVALTTNNPDACCYIDHMEVNGVEAITLAAWVLCGEAIPAEGAAFGHSGITMPCNVAVNTVLLYLSSHTPFTLKIFFSEESC